MRDSVREQESSISDISISDFRFEQAKTYRGLARIVNGFLFVLLISANPFTIREICGMQFCSRIASQAGLSKIGNQKLNAASLCIPLLLELHGLIKTKSKSRLKRAGF